MFDVNKKKGNLTVVLSSHKISNNVIRIVCIKCFPTNKDV